MMGSWSCVGVMVLAGGLVGADHTLSDENVHGVFSDDAATMGGLVELWSKTGEGSNVVAQTDGNVWGATFVGAGNGTASLQADTATCTSRTATPLPNGVQFKWDSCTVPLPQVDAAMVTVTVNVTLMKDSTFGYTFGVEGDGHCALWQYSMQVPSLNVTQRTARFSSTGVQQAHGYYDPRNNETAAAGVDAVYFAAHDPSHIDKQFQGTTAGTFKCSVTPPGQSLPLGSYTESFPYVLGVLPRGDWYDVASQYRAWATAHAEWLTKGALEHRADLPSWAADITMWMNNNWGGDPLTPNYGGDPMHVQLEFRALAERLNLAAHGGALGLHWYEWDTLGYELGSNNTKCDRDYAPCGFDTHYPEYFPARVGCKEAVTAMQGAGMRVIPYINGQLFDTLIPKYTNDNALHAVQKHFAQKTMTTAKVQPALTPHIEFFDNIHSAVVCPATDYWQNTMTDVMLRIVNEVGFDGVYVDQVGNGEPRQCSDPTHNHTIGGGDFWWKSFKKILTRVRDGAAQPTIYMTEGIQEQVAGDTFDILLGLEWAHEPLPMWHSVYGGYMFATGRAGSVVAPLGGGLADVFTQQFVQGGVMGWLTYQNYGTTWLDPAHATEVDYLVFLSKARMAGKPWMAYGRATRPLRLGANTTATLRTGCFVREEAASVVCVVANAAKDATPTAFTMAMAPTRHGLPSSTAYTLTDLMTGTVLGTYTGGPVTHSAVLTQYSAAVLLVSPAA